MQFYKSHHFKVIEKVLQLDWIINCKYNSVLIFDSDLEIPPPEIKKLMILDRNKNINSVLGYRYRHLKPLSSGLDWGNFIFTTFFNISFGTNHKDVLCCAKSFYIDKIDYKS